MSTSFVERFRAAVELLESIVGDRGLLSEVTREDQKRLVQAAGASSNRITWRGGGSSKPTETPQDKAAKTTA